MRLIRNMRLTVKLIAAFLIIAIIAAVIGVVGILGMSTIIKQDEEMYTFNTEPMGDLALMYDTLASQRICLSNMAIFREADPEFADSELKSLAEKEALFDSAMKDYSLGLSNDEEKNYYDLMSKNYYTDFAAIKENVKNAIASGDQAKISEAVKSMDDMGAQVSSYMDDAFKLNEDMASNKVNANKALSQQRTIILIIVLVVGVVLSIILALFLASLISRPLNRMLAATKQFGELGDLHLTEQQKMGIKKDANNKDEIGQFALSFSIMMDSLIEKTKVLEAIASGDLSSDVVLVSKQDTIGIALEEMIYSLNKMFNEINSSSSQVALASRQIADGAQSLAQGSTEQSETVNLLSKSVGDVANKTKQNADMAVQAAALGDIIKQSAEKGSHQMEMMINAVREINEASQSISKVIKTIDDIAFQTNILALNAAVEAARAGQHGKGFAVVAEEVRNLAQKSADSAKDTGSLIANSIEKTNLGVQIADETFASLSEIVSGINESSKIVSDIAKSSEEQSEAVLNINMGIDQVAQVVQNNSATAQESAAASEEMSSQASILENLVSHFKLKNAPVSHMIEEKPAYSFDDEYNDFGKY